jgi:hypothetical protein
MQARLAASIAVGITNPSPSPATAMMASTTMGHIDEKYRAHQNLDSNHPPRIGPSRRAIMAPTIGFEAKQACSMKPSKKSHPKAACAAQEWLFLRG